VADEQTSSKHEGITHSRRRRPRPTWIIHGVLEEFSRKRYARPRFSLVRTSARKTFPRLRVELYSQTISRKVAPAWLTYSACIGWCECTQANECIREFVAGGLTCPVTAAQRTLATFAFRSEITVRERLPPWQSTLSTDRMHYLRTVKGTPWDIVKYRGRRSRDKSRTGESISSRKWARIREN